MVVAEFSVFVFMQLNSWLLNHDLYFSESMSSFSDLSSLKLLFIKTLICVVKLIASFILTKPLKLNFIRINT